MASPLVRQIRFGKAYYRKRVIGIVEEFVDADSARRAVASLVEKINGDYGYSPVTIERVAKFRNRRVRSIFSTARR